MGAARTSDEREIDSMCEVIGSIADHPTLKIRTDEKCFTLRTMVGGVYWSL
jgi:hypothetical protein